MPRQLSTTKTLLTHCGLTLAKILAQLPYSALLKIGTALGWLTYHGIPRRRRIAQINLQLAFPELTDDERKTLLKKHFQSVGQGIMEMVMGWYGPKDRLRKLRHYVGREHIDEAVKSAKPIILLGAHTTSFETAGFALCDDYPIHPMFRPHENPIINQAMINSRMRWTESIIDRDDIKTLLKTLKRGETVWYASDQNYGLKHSIFSPFFGVPAATNNALRRLVKMSGAIVVPYFGRRRTDGSGFDLTFYPQLDNFPSDDEQFDIDRVNQTIETFVRTCPEQYFWLHRRYKDRPDGGPSPYEC